MIVSAPMATNMAVMIDHSSDWLSLLDKRWNISTKKNPPRKHVRYIEKCIYFLAILCHQLVSNSHIHFQFSFRCHPKRVNYLLLIGLHWQLDSMLMLHWLLRHPPTPYQAPMSLWLLRPSRPQVPTQITLFWGCLWSPR